MFKILRSECNLLILIDYESKMNAVSQFEITFILRFKLIASIVFMCMLDLIFTFMFLVYQPIGYLYFMLDVHQLPLFCSLYQSAYSTM